MNTNTANRLAPNLTFERGPDGVFRLGRTVQARRRQLAQESALARARSIVRGEVGLLQRVQMQNQVRRMFARFASNFGVRPRRDGRYLNPLTGRAFALPRNRAEFNQLERRMQQRVAPAAASVLTRALRAAQQRRSAQRADWRSLRPIAQLDESRRYQNANWVATFDTRSESYNGAPFNVIMQAVTHAAWTQCPFSQDGGFTFGGLEVAYSGDDIHLGDDFTTNTKGSGFPNGSIVRKEKIGFQREERIFEGEGNDVHEKRIRSLADLERVMKAFVANRVALDELYTDIQNEAFAAAQAPLAEIERCRTYWRTHRLGKPMYRLFEEFYRHHKEEGSLGRFIKGPRYCRDPSKTTLRIFAGIAASAVGFEGADQFSPAVHNAAFMRSYYDPISVRFSFWRRRHDRSERTGDKNSWLLTRMLSSVDAPRGDCMFQALIDQFAASRQTKIKHSVSELRAMTGLTDPSGMTHDDITQFEERFVIKGRGSLGREKRVGFALFDARGNLQRLPPYPGDQHGATNKYFCYVVEWNKHAYSFRDASLARELMKRGISYFEAALQCAGADKCYAEAYELFRETQHLRPDADAIDDYLREKLAIDPADIVLTNVSNSQKKFVARHKLQTHPQKPLYIAAKGLETRCDILGIQRCDGAAMSRRWDEIVDMGLTFRDAVFEMRSVLSMDLETCSIIDQPGRFYVYAVGFQYEELKVQYVAQNPDEILTNAVLWKALQKWNEIASEWKQVQLDEGVKEDKARPLYVYAHNGSRFDAVAALHTIIANDTEELPTDQLESNGKFISFAWRDLVFRDSCLIVMSSLAAACTSYGLETSKGYLPHRYLQNCASAQQVIDRLHGHPTWGELEHYMDWFHDAKDGDLHKRKAGRSYEEWRDQQPERIRFLERKDERFSFVEEMAAYLEKDVDCLHQLVDRVGTEFAETWHADIRTKCTIGSLATHIWQHTLLKRIPKLMSEDDHRFWQACNRGGFCGPLAGFDTRCDDEEIFKVDVTSLYPSSAMPIKFETSAGVQEPIARWYHSFPDPTKGWSTHDYEYCEMTDEHWESLGTMYGAIRIKFDQSGCKFPVLLLKMSEGTWGTLAPVMRGEEVYTIPQIRHAHDKGVKIQLGECRYTEQCCEPFSEYMKLFAKIKNDADALQKKTKSVLKAATPEERLELAKAWCEVAKTSTPPEHLSDEELGDWLVKTEQDRTVAKLFLNSLLGRINMKIERSQTLITHSANDVIALLSDRHNYSGTDIEEVFCGDESVLRAKFKEGDYSDHIKVFDVAPYLSAYMLGYSKILMQETFQYLAEIGATPLYTDTDSVAFKATQEQYELYAARFIPTKKTLGGMELEGVFKRLVTIGPKKYVCVEENGDYEWHANGMPAKANVQVDVLTKFESVLGGKTESIDYFSITAGKDFTLNHTDGASKKLRFICLKGAVVDGGIRWWNDREEFATYARSIAPMGWEDFTKKDLNKELKAMDISEDMTLNEVRSELGKRLGASVTKEQLSTDRIVRQKLVTNCDQLEAAVNDGAEMPANVVAPDQVMRDAQKKRGVDAIDENEYFVYILRRTDDPTLNDTYIGQTKQPEARLDEHNEKRRKGKGAKCTRGRLWTHHAVIGGFGSKRDSLRFEAQLHQGQYDSYLDAAEAAEELMKTWEGLFWEKRG